MPDFPKVELPEMVLEGFRTKLHVDDAERSIDVPANGTNMRFVCVRNVKLGTLPAGRFLLSGSVAGTLKGGGENCYSGVYTCLTKNSHPEGEQITVSPWELADFVGEITAETASTTYTLTTYHRTETYVLLAADSDVYVNLWFGGRMTSAKPAYTAWGKLLKGVVKVLGFWS